LKPPVFSYHDPHTVEEALSVLSEHAEDGKVLAGGQSLVPLLNFRLAQPEHVIDINGLGELAGIRRRDGVLRVGAMTRQSQMEHSELVARIWPLLTEALGYVGHAQIRNRGTVGGSVAHADPAAELPVAFLALDATFHARSGRGTRAIPAREFFVTHLTTTLEPDELLVEIETPPVPAGTGYAFVEYARRHGDFALGGAAVLLGTDAGGACRRASIALLAAAATPLRAAEAERALIGSKVDEKAAATAAERAVADINPTGDMHGSSEYRRDLIEVMVRRGILSAAARIGNGAAAAANSGGV
jgi:CO/xanthine dehydrogenase FAD-binding subunit